MVHIIIPKNEFGIAPGLVPVTDLAHLLREHKNNPMAILFIASLLEG